MGAAVDVKGKGKAAGRRKSVAPKRRKSVAPKAKVAEESENEQPVAGEVYFVDYMRVYVTVCYRSFPYYEGIHEDNEAQERGNRD